MHFPSDFLDEIRARLSVSQVVGRRVKLRRQGREFVGLSPFKTEKTPSFTVNDQKGFYHCFATGEHGDIFTFLMKTEGLSFPESVERLAGEAGIPMPVQSPEAAVRRDTNDRLREVMAQSAAFFQSCLKQPAAAHAREYLTKRGITGEVAASFGIGYAPPSREALKDHLRREGHAEQDLITAGMLIGGPDIRTPYDRFRDRIIFPITDLKERVIAFGGRALSSDVPAKYLNSPETPLFHKGYQLYNAAKARQSAYERKTVYVAEGYMDVIAMAINGLTNAVAPLGTALTPEQIQLLWRMTEEPVLCFDGDAAGKKAAERAVETALPILKPGHSLKFAFLPDGKDPDDILKEGGRSALELHLEAAKPLVEILWHKEFTKDDRSTPERRAALEQTLTNLIQTIEDQTVRGHYMREIKSRIWQAFRAAPPPPKERSAAGYKPGYKAPNSQGNRGGFAGKMPATSYLAESPLAKGQQNPPNPGREALFLTLLLDHPWLLEDHDEEVASLKFATDTAETLRNALLEAHFTYNSLDRSQLQSHLETLDLSSQAARMRRIVTQNGTRIAEETADPQLVREKWQELMMLHHKAEELKRELDAAERALLENNSEQNFERLKSLKQALEKSLNEVE